MSDLYFICLGGDMDMPTSREVSVFTGGLRVCFMAAARSSTLGVRTIMAFLSGGGYISL